MKKTLLAVLIGIVVVGGALLSSKQINKTKDAALSNPTYVPYGTKPGG